MTKLIPLHGKHGEGKFAIVDDDVFEYLSQFGWSVTKNGYPRRNAKTEQGWRQQRMHQDVLDLQRGEWGDHKNGDRLDNRMENLRRCSLEQNAQNRAINKHKNTRFKGIAKEGRKYWARIRVEGKALYLGIYETDIEAAQAYDKAARQHFGEFARTNF